MKCFGWVYKSKLSVYQEGKVNSQSVAFSHKVCRENMSKNYSFVAEIMWTVIKKGLIFPLFPSFICLILVQIVLLVNQIIPDQQSLLANLRSRCGFSSPAAREGPRHHRSHRREPRPHRGQSRTCLEGSQQTNSSTHSTDQNKPLGQRCYSLSQQVSRFTWSHPVMDGCDLFVHGAVCAPL